MRLFARLSLVALFAAAAGSVTLAHATPITLTLTGVSLADGGSLTGTITFSSSSLSQITGYSITAPSGEINNGHTFAGYTYTPSDSTVSDLTAYLIQIDSPGDLDELRLSFANPLTATGEAIYIGGYSYESENRSGGNRVIDGGSLSPAVVAATPEPSSLLLLGTGILGAAGALRRRFLKA